jgi:hypothetical protein
VGVVRRPQSAAECVSLQDKSNGVRSEVIGRFRVQFKLSTIQRTILKRMDTFYDDEAIDSILRPILCPPEERARSPSLRVIDWLTVNYAKSENLATRDAHGNVFGVYQGYRIALQHYRRRNFDPFRRRLRLTCIHKNGNLQSTVGQLNFLAWAHQNGVLEYAKNFTPEVEKHMNNATLRSKEARAEAKVMGRKTSRRELSQASTNKVIIYECDAKEFKLR